MKELLTKLEDVILRNIENIKIINTFGKEIRFSININGSEYVYRLNYCDLYIRNVLYKLPTTRIYDKLHEIFDYDIRYEMLKEHVEDILEDEDSDSIESLSD